MTQVARSLGRYELLDVIDSGGMAIVYRARQAGLRRLVAIKELREFHDPHGSFAQRFVQEAQLAGSLNHPNVVTVHDLFEHGGTPYIVMEYLPRGSLRPYMRELSLAQAAGVFEGLLAGLAHAERAGIVHRDLKPENVMVTAEGSSKIADFGIAKVMNDLRTEGFHTATGMTLGTPTYMAPEQALATRIGPWTDLYAVGVIAFEIFSGQLPFETTGGPMAIMQRHLSVPPPDVRELNPGVPADVAGWIARLLDKDPGLRTQSAPIAWAQLEEVVIELLGSHWQRRARLPELPAPAGGGGHDDGSSAYTTFEAGKLGRAVPGPATPPPGDLPEGPMMPGSVEVPVGPSTPAALPSAGGDAESGGRARGPEAGDDAERGRGASGPQAGDDAEPGRGAPGPQAGDDAEPGRGARGPEAGDDAQPGRGAPAPDADDGAGRTVAPRTRPLARSPQPRHRRRRAVALAIAATIVVASALAATALRGSDPARRSPPPLALAAGPVSVRVPAGWRRTSAPPAARELGLAPAAAAAGPSRGSVAIGLAPPSASNALLLRPAFRAGLVTAPAGPGEIVRDLAGGLQAYRYDDLRPHAGGDALTVYVSPTSRGVATIGCSATAADCATIARSLAVGAATPFAVGPDPGYAARVNRGLRALRVALGRSSARISARRTARGQSQAALAIARAYRTSRARLTTSRLSPADVALATGLRKAFAGASDAYDELARAARRNRPVTYRRAARRARRAQAAIVSALRRLRAAGYGSLVTERYRRRSIPALKLPVRIAPRAVATPTVVAQPRPIAPVAPPPVAFAPPPQAPPPPPPPSKQTPVFVP